MLIVKGSAYRIHFWYMSKYDAINIMNSSNLVDKKNVLYIFFITDFLVIYKNEWEYWFNLLNLFISIIRVTI